MQSLHWFKQYFISLYTIQIFNTLHNQWIRINESISEFILELMHLIYLIWYLIFLTLLGFLVCTYMVHNKMCLLYHFYLSIEI